MRVDIYTSIKLTGIIMSICKLVSGEKDEVHLSDYKHLQRPAEVDFMKGL